MARQHCLLILAAALVVAGEHNFASCYILDGDDGKADSFLVAHALLKADADVKHKGEEHIKFRFHTEPWHFTTVQKYNFVWVSIRHWSHNLLFCR